MAYDVELADRLRELTAGEPGLTEQRMFGGLAFLVGGHMAVAASSSGGLLVRTDPAQTEELLADPHARPFAMRGRDLRGWLHVDLGSSAADAELSPWVDRALQYVRSLPPK